MKPSLLLILALCAPTQALESETLIRLYSRQNVKTIEVETEGAHVLHGDKPLKGNVRVSASGGLVSMDGAATLHKAKSLTLTAYGNGAWLSGRGLPRRLYRGRIHITSEAGFLKIINSVDLESYLAGVVTGEAMDLKHLEAFKAQAIAARTYTIKLRNNHRKHGYHLCDSTHCQLYTGQGGISQKAAEAADSTRDEVLLYKGKPASTFYHSACGGRTEDMTFVWPFERRPYLVTVRDGPAAKPYCAGAPRFRWKTKVYFSGLTRLARKAGWIGPGEEARGLHITSWGASGRAYELEIYTRTRRVRIKATDLYHVVGRNENWQALPSTMFRITTEKDSVILEGKGSGHGVGMCQWGADGMAAAGKDYRQILLHYYPGTKISQY